LTIAVFLAASLWGCGASKDNLPDTGNYLANIVTSRWEKPTVTYYISPSTDIFGHDRTSDVQRGLMRWQGALTGRLTFQATNQTDADIVFSFATTSQLQDIENSVSRGFLNQLLDALLPQNRGVTVLTYQDDAAQSLQSAHCYLNSSLIGTPVADTAAHEMGHALGIRGHSNRKEDLMYQDIPDGGNLAQRDINTIQAIYPLPSPSPTPTPSPSPTPSPTPTPSPSPTPTPSPSPSPTPTP
jgi:hypothetical protein